MISPDLQKKIDRSIRLLRSIIPPPNQPIEIAYSEGKDSDVILQLAREAGINYRAIYKNTTIDPPGTIKHATVMGAQVITPTKTFFQLISEAGLPNGNYRFCCRYLKEYKIYDKVVLGVRRDESVRRSKQYSEPTECKFYGKTKSDANHIEAIYPILDWTDQDVLDFITDRHIQCAPRYYDSEGHFHVERRLGCIGCPLQYTKKRIQSFREYPRMVRLYLKHIKLWWDNPKHENSSTRSRFDDIYEWFVRDVFYDDTKKFEADKNSIYGRPDYKQMLEDYFGIDLTV